MAKTTVPDTVVVIDDELHNMAWMLDYLEHKNLRSVTASNVEEAILVLTKEIYRAAIIDLNIPSTLPTADEYDPKSLVYKKFPGLYVAKFARNRGYRGKQVVIYSVHKDPEVAEEARRIGCTYIIKGRPKEIKEELDEITRYDPTSG